jgi:hypothetical protein
MESEQSAFSRSQLHAAQETLKETLEEACKTRVYGANTGELIRLEEMLAIADEAAKEAISIRRRRRRETDQPRPGLGAAHQGTATLPTSSETAAPGAHRLFDDARGVRWDAFAIYPSTMTAARVRLPEPYQGGWLSFDSPDEKRRLSPIPDGWQSLPDDALRVLCGKAEIVPRRTGAPGRRIDDH